MADVELDQCTRPDLASGGRYRYGFFTLLVVIARPRNGGVAIRLDGLLRRCAPRHDKTWRG